jgi:glycosyl hydrolase family 115 (putative glucuronidase)
VAGTGTFITTSLDAAVFSLVDDGVAAPIVVSDSDHAGVVRVAGDLSADLARVTGVAPTVSTDGMPVAREVVVVGTIGRCPYIDDLLRKGRLDAAAIVGKWETSLQQVVTDPWPGVERAFVIAGSDQRGTIFGAYEVSKQIGISAWYWWDDVPAPHRDALYVQPGAFTQGTPAVRYRGFFINDENPNLGTWAPRFFGPGHADGYPDGFNHRLYAKVFEVLLRLKGNCLWPAVWNRAFAEDDPDNQATATAYGVIMGTSHEAPMMRGIEEWNRHPSGNGEWSFRRNAAAIERFWRHGIRRMSDEGVEGIVTLGMRGNGDASLSDGDGIELMEAILAGQRGILGEFGMASLPQVFMLYKEVQRYWDRGLRPSEDVTVLFADDNWGNLRKLPEQSLPRRPGGYGLYYHFDYVGGGRSYKWVDTTNLPNTWEQLNLTFTYGVDRLWVANVGDLKGAELPLQFFLDFAWKPIALEDIAGWERAYAAQNLGGAIAHEIAEVLHEYGRLQARRKPELLNRRIHFDEGTKEVTHDDEASPFSLINYGEIDRVTSEWERLASTVDALEAKLPAEYADAFFELVGYAVKACANLYALRRAEFLNRLYADQGRAAANDLADAAEARFADDRALTDRFDSLADGKWRGFQRQAHIGYGDVARYGPEARWQQPERNHAPLPDEIFPPVRRIALPEAAAMGVAVDGSDGWWPGLRDGAVLPTFSPYQSQPPQYL